MYRIGSVGRAGLRNNAGADDAFLAKYDASGTLQWIQQLGTSSRETSRGVSADGLGNVYISGATEGSLGGANAGGGGYLEGDVYVAKFLDPLLGDLNLDGDVNGLDVDPFVDVLINGTDDNATRLRADMNSDGAVNGLDIDPFVAAVVGTGAAAVPSPAPSSSASSLWPCSAAGASGTSDHSGGAKQTHLRTPHRPVCGRRVAVCFQSGSTEAIGR